MSEAGAEDYDDCSFDDIPLGSIKQDQPQKAEPEKISFEQPLPPQVVDKENKVQEVLSSGKKINADLELHVAPSSGQMPELCAADTSESSISKHQVSESKPGDATNQRRPVNNNKL